MTRSGTVFPLPPLALLTGGTESGSSPTPAYRAGITHKPTHSVPTPTASDHIERRSTSKEVLNPETNKSVSLDRWVKFWPTPSSRDGKGGYIGGRIRNGKVSWDTLDVAVQHTDNQSKTGGQLNPTWVEWLMGFPVGWTDLSN